MVYCFAWIVCCCPCPMCQWFISILTHLHRTHSLSNSLTLHCSNDISIDIKSSLALFRSLSLATHHRPLSTTRLFPVSARSTTQQYTQMRANCSKYSTECGELCMHVPCVWDRRATNVSANILNLVNAITSYLLWFATEFSPDHVRTVLFTMDNGQENKRENVERSNYSEE